MPSSGLKEWPSYGSFPYVGRYFRMHHGSSNKQFSDVPSASIIRLIENLNQIEHESDNIDDFKRQALLKIERFNSEIVKQFSTPEGMIKASLDRYYWGSKDPMLGLRIAVNFEKFQGFVLSKSEVIVDIWKTFEYVYVSKNIFIQKALEELDFDNKIKKYTGEVKEFSSKYLDSIQDSYGNLNSCIQHVISSILKSTRTEKNKKGQRLAYFPYAFSYFNEMRFRITSMAAVSQNGDFPACLAEMRRMMEGLSFSIFLDTLQIKALRSEEKAKYIDLLAPFSQGSIKEAGKHHMNPKLISLDKNGQINNSILRGLIKNDRLGNEAKRKVIQQVYNKMSIASYLLISGVYKKKNKIVKGWTEDKINDSKLMFIDYAEEGNKEFINLGASEIACALSQSGINVTETQVKDYILSEMDGGEIILLPPTSKYPFDFLSQTYKTKKVWLDMGTLYNELSSFVHTSWESSIVWPFTSVLEIMTFGSVLSRFVSLICAALEDYISFFEAERDHLFIR